MNDTYTGGDLFLDALSQYGVEHLFGNPGTTELPVMEALSDSDLEYVLGLHEDIAVGMAAGYASTKRYESHHDLDVNPLGVVNLHITPGLAHGLGNMYGASVTGAPLLVTAGNHSTDFRHEEPILSGELVEMTEQFTKWSAEVLDVETLPTMLRRAVRVALTPPTGPVFLGLPLDVMMAETDAEPERLGPIPTAGRGDRAQIDRAATLLADAESPVLVMGDHVPRAGADAVESAVAVAEACGAGVYSEILGSEVHFPTDHEQYIGSFPGTSDHPAGIRSSDTVLFAGCSTNTSVTKHEGDLVPPETTCIHVSDDAWQIGKNQTADAAVIGDPGSVLEQLADAIEDRVSAADRERRLSAVAERKQTAAEASRSGGEPKPDDPRLSKSELVDGLRSAASDALVVNESNTSAFVLRDRWSFEPEHYLANKGGGLGYGLPASIGAAIAESTRDEPRDVVGFIGDGSYMYYPHSLYTAARYDLDMTVVIPDNRNYRILKNNAIRLFDRDESTFDFIGMDFDPPVDLPANASSHGVEGHLVEDPESLEATLETAIQSDGTHVVDALVHD